MLFCFQLVVDEGLTNGEVETNLNDVKPVFQSTSGYSEPQRSMDSESRSATPEFNHKDLSG